jgi:Ran GTPase-activating protein (RanGAP) involved in mRNA processing and transport
MLNSYFIGSLQFFNTLIIKISCFLGLLKKKAKTEKIVRNFISVRNIIFYGIFYTKSVLEVRSLLDCFALKVTQLILPTSMKTLTNLPDLTKSCRYPQAQFLLV